MSKPNESALRGFLNPSAIVVGVLCLAMLGFFWLRVTFRHSLDRADGFELTQNLKRWGEAGRPEGKKLTEFMQGRRPDIVFSNQLLAIGGTNFVTQFALTKPKSGRAGTLFVTTNEVLIWADMSGRSELFTLGRPR